MEPPKGLTSVPRKGSIVFDPKPRRGAPRRPSISSIATSPKKDHSDEEDEDQAPVPEPKSAAEILAEEMALREVEETEHRIKLEAIASLARDAKSVIDQFQNHGSPLAHEKLLHMKMQSFKASRSVFAPPQQASLFLDWDWVNKAGLDTPDAAKITVPLVIRLANIATALGQIESIQSQGFSPVPFLDAIDPIFPRHFAAERSNRYMELSLEVRTQRAIENIARSPPATDQRGMLGHVFCDMNNPNVPTRYPELFMRGPYRPLAGLNVPDVCANRVLNMWRIMSEGGERGIRTPVDLPSIRASYPLHDVLGFLKEWLLDRYSTVSQLLKAVEHDQMAREKQMLQEQWRAEDELRAREERSRGEPPPLPDEESLRSLPGEDGSYHEALERSSQSLASSQPEPPRRIERREEKASEEKRLVWSDRDSATLVELIARRAAGWSVMDKEDGHLFQLPRNAQAYRDRARNMKVDFLISDAVLPQGFDLVTLSRKEIERLHKLGKNHERRERDVDRNGKPTNTEAV
ncbi:sant swi3 [Trichoderma cornu-damae]|uniref:Sant swi3 n=1 Tax=Trichoderma cornu-damae TaxID=654480 RepID=A0A9P8QLH9_9HYPO|nr:sant swi3 [Trichoderma cornu-damae]